MEDLTLAGQSLTGGECTHASAASFCGINPVSGEELSPRFYSASAEQVARAATSADEAFPIFAATSGRARAALLYGIADGLTANTETIVKRAHLETGLPLSRLNGEMARTTGQLKLFAGVLEEGSWVDARIDSAQPARTPLPRSDIRSMLRPLGPVAVFGASNFPLAFSVAGGDTASALAAGNPVIVKAHPAHPGTSEFVGRIIQEALHRAGLPAGVFALLFDSGIEVGRTLVRHPSVKAVAFTGSTVAGQALMRLASDREQPIPCYAEMGSANPLFILPGAMRERAVSLALGIQGSFTLGSGQFCTKPGLVFVPQTGSKPFLEALQSGVDRMGPYGMLTRGIATAYGTAVNRRRDEAGTQHIAGPAVSPDAAAASGTPEVFSVSLADFLAEPALEDEIFGPTTLLVQYGSETDLVTVARAMHGHLTATIHATPEDLERVGDLVAVLETKVGRILFNGYPTGVEVCPAMVHGGPYPATSDGRSTSVGTRAMLRFARPVCYQDFPDAALPPELQRRNPISIMRLVDGALTRSDQH